jgi:ATP-dependent Clp protease, protease subunit
MSDLYNENRTSSTNTEVSYTETNSAEKDKHFQEFREFDYGIDIKDNIIIIQDVIQTGQLFDFVSKVRLLKKINPKLKTITLLLNSGGGDVVETLGLIDYIRSLRDGEDIKVNIVCRGMAMSAAAMLLSAGTGIRVASKHSKIMVHQLSSYAAGKLGDLKSNAKFAEQLEDDCNSIMEQCTNKDKSWWKDNQQNDYFLSAQQALELGIIDKII